MSVETELTELQEEKPTSLDNDLDEKQYRIFDYFKDHTGLLVTSISALVAIMSFIIHFAVNRMNYAYLAYWNIPALHANTNNQNELDMVVCALIYMVSLFLVQSFLGKTSDVYRYYNRLLSLVNQSIKISKKTNKQARKKVREYSAMIDLLSNDDNADQEKEATKKRLDECKGFIKESTKGIREVKKARRKLRWWVTTKLVSAVLLSCFIGGVCVFLLNAAATIQDSLRLTSSVIFIIIINFLSCFLPAFLGTWRWGKKMTNEEILARTAELIDKDVPKFPFQSFMKNGIKPILTDKKIKRVAILSVVMTVVLLLTMAAGGTLVAENQNRFPIYTDEATSYAVVYTSGSTRYMEEAVIQNGTITIDTTKQRIITSDDISYNMEVFENVVVIRNDDKQEKEQHILFTEDFSKTINSVFETLKTKLKEVFTKNEGSVSGTECQPTTGN